MKGMDAADESVRVTTAGFLTGLVKGGSARESVVGCGGCADAAGVDTTTT
jgi:hypothetical protein